MCQKKITTILKYYIQKISFKSDSEILSPPQTKLKSCHQQIPLKVIRNGTLQPEEKWSHIGVFKYSTLWRAIELIKLWVNLNINTIKNKKYRLYRELNIYENIAYIRKGVNREEEC